MLREGTVIGTITIRRQEVQPFSETQVALLQTFAAQAVIAIENVRLFQELQARNRELTESLEQQTATAEILRVISSSPTDVQPVFDTIARSAVQLCEGDAGAVIRLEGELAHLVAAYDIAPDRLKVLAPRYPMRLSRAFALPRAIVDRAIVHIPDTRQDPDYDQEYVSRTGGQSLVAVPLLREGRPIGAIAVSRARVGPFSDNQIRLLQTFADQAVIAIENARLFETLESRNRELTESLEQQTATSEILGVISSSPTDWQPVFDAIVRNTSRLCDGQWAFAVRFDGELMHLAAQHAARRGLTEVVSDSIRAGRDKSWPRDERSSSGRPSISPTSRRTPTSTRRRFARRAPQLPRRSDDARARADRRLRGLASDAGAVRPRHIELLKTFADQAVIAIENVRLFQELQARNRELTEALEQQTATSEVLKVISRSTFDLEPVLATLIESAVTLCGANSGLVYRQDGDLYRLVAACGPPRRLSS